MVGGVRYKPPPATAEVFKDKKLKYHEGEIVNAKDFRDHRVKWTQGKNPKILGNTVCIVEVQDMTWKRHFSQLRKCAQDAHDDVLMIKLSSRSTSPLTVKMNRLDRITHRKTDTYLKKRCFTMQQPQSATDKKSGSRQEVTRTNLRKDTPATNNVLSVECKNHTEIVILVCICRMELI